MPFSIAVPAPVPSAPTRRSCEAAARLGLDLGDLPTPPARTVALDLAPGTITLLTGPSGAGKTALLNAAIAEWRSRARRIVEPERLALRNAPLVDLFRAPVDHAMNALAHAGLADARLIVRRPRELSAGELARLRLALALDRARRSHHPTLIATDEFLTTLDRHTALAVAATLRRAVTRPGGPAVLAATAHDDVASALRPDVHLALDEGSPLARRIDHDGAPDFAARFTPRIATPDEVIPLMRLHYRPARVAGVAQRWALVDELTGEIAGAMLVAMPTLDAPWREAAWPGRYTGPDRRENVRRLNREVRRIARVVLLPRCRGFGLASKLVRAYLDSPRTPRTEALAAMAAHRPFFRAAGMTEHDVPPSRRDRRLLDILQANAVEPWRLACAASSLPRVREALGEDLFTRELTRWTTDSRATRRLADAIAADPLPAWKAACRSIVCRPLAYTHGE